MLAISFAGFTLAAIWLQTGRKLQVRLLWTAALCMILALVTIGGAGLRAS